jgi:hypothetical protein
MAGGAPIFPENRASIALHHSAGYRTFIVLARAKT